MKTRMIALAAMLIAAAAAAAPAGTARYMFVAAKSTVVQTGGFAGVRETYTVTGQFQLTVDFEQKTASFDWVRARLSEGPFLPTADLGTLFNMTALEATSVEPERIVFTGTTGDRTEAKVEIVVTPEGSSMHLVGAIRSPCCDLFDYALDAVARKLPPPPPPPGPVIKYSVASPRACLIGPPRWSTNLYYMPAGDAENFPRKSGSLRVRVGTRVVFCLSRDLENVWYSGSYGCMGNSLVLQYCRACKCTAADVADCPGNECSCEQCRSLGLAAAEPEPGAAPVTDCPWVTIGRDGSKDCRKGPSIGRAKVGVPVTFRRPGYYLLRAIVHTFARPGYPLPLEPWRQRLLGSNDPAIPLPQIPPAEDRDVVYIRVRVTDCIIGEVEPEEVPTDDPDCVHIRPIPKEIDPNVPVLSTDSDLNGDEVVNWADLAIMAQQWGKEYEMPFTDDE